MYSILFLYLFTRNYYIYDIYMFQHFNHSTFTPYLFSSLQFLFLLLSISFPFSPFPLKLPHRSVRLPRFSSHSRTNGSILYLRNAISGWIERIRIHRAMWFSSDRNKRRVPCGSSTRVCISACARRWAQVCSRLIERGGREWRRGGDAFEISMHAFRASFQRRRPLKN